MEDEITHLKTSDFDYTLPPELIAQEPIEPRDSSRLMVLDKEKNAISDDIFKNLAGYLQEGDILVLNESRVIPARIYGLKKGTGAKVEILLLKRYENGDWEALVKPGKRLKTGTVIEICPQGVFGTVLENVTASVKEVLDEGIRVIMFSDEKALYTLGIMPLPPYIKTKLRKPERYQTVYSKNFGSVAAPTAGLHFTEEMFEALKSKGVTVCFVNLHIGLDTFRPVSTEDPRNHPIHSEYGEITKETAEIINRTKKSGHNVVAVGTSTMRLLEHTAKLGEEGMLESFKGWVDTFILPGYEFKAVSGMVTNFHLPKSTLLMLVSSFAGKDLIDKAYRHAIEEKYRFYSFGDAMLII